MIEVKYIIKTFDGIEVLKGISSVFEKGKTNLIIGQSGSGKTVFLKCLLGLLEADSGKILFEGKGLEKMSVKERSVLRQEMGMVFQGSALFDSMTVEENIMFPMQMFTKKDDDEIRERANLVIKRVNLINSNSKYPDEISGGMKKRVAIARALAINPQMIFYDEPTSELDPLSAVTIGKQILHLNKEFGTTSIIVTHDRDLAFGIGHKIAIMHQGKLSEPKTPNELLEKADEDIQRFLSAGKFEDYQSEATRPTV